MILTPVHARLHERFFKTHVLDILFFFILAVLIGARLWNMLGERPEEDEDDFSKPTRHKKGAVFLSSDQIRIEKIDPILGPEKDFFHDVETLFKTILHGLQRPNRTHLALHCSDKARERLENLVRPHHTVTLFNRVVLEKKQEDNLALATLQLKIYKKDKNIETTETWVWTLSKIQDETNGQQGEKEEKKAWFLRDVA